MAKAGGTTRVEASVPAMRAPEIRRDNPLTRSVAGVMGLVTLGVMVLACFGSLPWTLGWWSEGEAIYERTDPNLGRLPPWWAPRDGYDAKRLSEAVGSERLAAISASTGVEVNSLLEANSGEAGAAEAAGAAEVRAAWPRYALGTDSLGRSLLARCLLGGTVSLFIGVAAALMSVLIGTLYGAVAGYAGGWLDGAMMRVVDVLYGLPYILLVVLLAVAGDAVIEEMTTKGKARESWIRARAAEVYRLHEGAGAQAVTRDLVDAFRREPASGYAESLERVLGRAGVGEAGSSAVGSGSGAGSGAGAGSVGEVLAEAALVAVPQPVSRPEVRRVLDLLTLLVAIGGVSWLTMARVIRGQVLSLKSQQFVEAARAQGASGARVFVQHLLPNLVGPIVVYATLTVPQAILQESFLSFLGIGVEDLPSWGNLASDGLPEVNRHKSHWWMLVFPSVLLAVTLVALNFVGEGLREAFDPKRSRR